MAKNNSAPAKELKQFIADLNILSKLPVTKNMQSMQLEEFPFDGQLLKLSSLYRESRKHYSSLGGQFNPKVSSMMRSLRAQDLFKNEIDYSPTMSEMLWFKEHITEADDAATEMKSLKQFNENSLFHEQNHRIIWKLLPPAPKEKKAMHRYLNFAESLVVTLDLALGDQIGTKLSPAFERMNVIYRPAGKQKWHLQSKSIYQKYLLSLLCTTYLALELIHHDDILKVVDFIFPGQKKMNAQAVARGLELNHLFTLNTNPQWQNLYWKEAQKKLSKIHHDRTDEALMIAEDPLDLNFEFAYARAVLYYFGL